MLKNPQPEIELSTEIMDLEMNDPYVWVNTEQQLKELVNVLSKERFFAVDTEQHSLRSFLGFTALVQVSLCCFNPSSLIACQSFIFSVKCLICVSFHAIKQISTQKKDYLVDTIALHDLMGILRPVFANPSICKVCKLSVSYF